MIAKYLLSLNVYFKFYVLKVEIKQNLKLEKKNIYYVSKKSWAFRCLFTCRRET